MAKLLFLQDLEYEYLGPMYISSMLKKHGHEVLLHIGNKLSDFEQTISQYRPDFVAFSIMSGSHYWAWNMAKQVKKEFGIPMIVAANKTDISKTTEKADMSMSTLTGDGVGVVLERLLEMMPAQDLNIINNH